MATLHLVGKSAGHVVAQVIKAKFIVRAIGDVARIVVTLLGRSLAKAWDNKTDIESHELMNAAHPLGMEASKIIVDGDDMHTLAGQSVEIRRQRGNKCLALACLHLGNPTKVQGGSTHQLDIEVALTNDSARCFSHHGEGFDQEVVQFLATLETGTELASLCPQGVV